MAAEAFQGEVVGKTARLDGSRVPILRFGTTVVDQTVTGAIAAVVPCAGEAIGGVTRVQPAAEVMRELAQGGDALVQR